VTGTTVLLSSRTRAAGCRVGARPDRRCSPGAYDAGLTKAVLCSATFRTSAVRHVTESEKHAVEREYGLSQRGYGSTLEIDHIIPLELGGSNDIANLFPERASFVGGDPGFRLKDKLENRLHELVCSGAMRLSAARSGIASDWIALYSNAFG
jgi:HNH endonuclease